MLATQSGRHGKFDGVQYLADAERGYAHLRRFNPRYFADGKENIIDDYTALMALVELHNATGKQACLDDARARAASLMGRQQADGGFLSDGGIRPYYHAAEAGLPVISLAFYTDIEPDQARRERALRAIGLSLAHELAITGAVSNPYGYARQRFQLARDGKGSSSRTAMKRAIGGRAKAQGWRRSARP
ncbi:MAG TPA: hypothetical protein DD456_04495 [Stenotrophomonas sp.]|nr:hypothetical protein [Stenotrophomonas sp.]